MTKQCTKCKETKPLEEFGSNKRMRDGRQRRCFECVRVDFAQRRARWTPEQKERDRARPRKRSRVNEKKRINRRDNRTPEQRREAGRARTASTYEKLNAYKLAAGCADCGYRQHVAALEFDHLPGVVWGGTVSSLAGNRSWRTLLIEIAKCEVVCANCHNIRTYNRRNGIVPATSDGE